MENKTHRLTLFFNTVSFVLGFTAVFVLLGASVGVVSSGLATPKSGWPGSVVCSLSVSGW